MEHSGTGFGVAAKDVLMEYGGQGLYEFLDPQIGQCKLRAAGTISVTELKGRSRVATKFVNGPKRYHAKLLLHIKWSTGLTVDQSTDSVARAAAGITNALSMATSTHSNA